MDPFDFHAGDDLPSMYMFCCDTDAGVLVDVSNMTVYAKFRLKGTVDTLATIVCAHIAPTLGLVRLDWGDTTLDVTAGRYEIEVSFEDNTTNKVQTANAHYKQELPSDKSKECQVRINSQFS